MSSGLLQGATIGVLVAEIVIDSDDAIRQSVATGAGFVALQLPWFKPTRSLSIFGRVGIIIGSVSGLCGAMGKFPSEPLSFCKQCIQRWIARYSDEIPVDDIRDQMPENERNRWK